jgi:hypothetical protein
MEGRKEGRGTEETCYERWKGQTMSIFTLVSSYKTPFIDFMVGKVERTEERKEGRKEGRKE